MPGQKEKKNGKAAHVVDINEASELLNNHDEAKLREVAAVLGWKLTGELKLHHAVTRLILEDNGNVSTLMLRVRMTFRSLFRVLTISLAF